MARTWNTPHNPQSPRETARNTVKPPPCDITADASEQSEHSASDPDESSPQRLHLHGRLLSMQAHLDALANTPTVGECLHLFFADATGRIAIGDLCESTCKNYRSFAQHITEEMRATPIGALRRPAVKAWHRALAMRCHPTTGRRLTSAADNALRFLSILFTWAEDELDLKLDGSPTARVKRVHKTRGARALGDEELGEYRKALAAHEHARGLRVRTLRNGHPLLIAAYGPTVALRLLDLTGCRPSEIRTLRVEHVSLDRRMLLLDHTKTDEGAGRPLSEAACEVLRQHLVRLGNPTTGWLFPSRRKPGKCISAGGLTDVHKIVCRIAGIVVTQYGMRHTMVSRGFAKGFTSTAASGAAGHSREKSFNTYRHVVPQESFDLVEAHARTPGRAA